MKKRLKVRSKLFDAYFIVESPSERRERWEMGDMPRWYLNDGKKAAGQTGTNCCHPSHAYGPGQPLRQPNFSKKPANGRSSRRHHDNLRALSISRSGQFLKQLFKPPIVIVLDHPRRPFKSLLPTTVIELPTTLSARSAGRVAAASLHP
jgi:hypothetical protein